MTIEESQLCLYEARKGAAWLTLNRPKKRNALSAELVGAIYNNLQTAIEDKRVRCIVLTGAGTAFCSGADLHDPPGSMIKGQSTVTYATLLSAIMDSPKPVVVGINGPAFAGGLGLVVASDIVITAEDAIMSFSEVRIGVIPAVIAVPTLAKLGPNHTMRLFITGAQLDGLEAVQNGLAHRAVPSADLYDAIQEEVDMIRLGGPNAVTECKKVVQLAPTWSKEQAFDITSQWSARSFTSEEGLEGIAAFREKRKPSWVTDVSSLN